MTITQVLLRGNKAMKIMILIADSNGGYLVPAAKGGAVSTLVEHIVSGVQKS